MAKCYIAITAIAAYMLAGAPALAQANKDQTQAQKPKWDHYLDEILASGEETGVGYADPNEKVDGPKTIAGSKAFVSPVPFFRDLKPWDPNYQPPRTADGRPDLQGVWSTASLTTMERGGNNNPVGESLVIAPEKLAEITRNTKYAAGLAVGQKRTDPNAGVFTDQAVEAGYNVFWMDPGAEYAKVDTEWRSSWITSPANGQVPYAPQGSEARQQRMADVRSKKNTGYELRPAGERCFISYDSQGGPPLNNTMYNNNIQIVQTPDSVMIDIEMNHDARIINIAEKSGVKDRPDAVKPWFGDAIGHWEGDTLVVVSRNFNPSQQRLGLYPVSDKGQVTEWFKRVSDDVIDYRFEVKDPVYYTQSWTGQIPLRRSKEHLYEYACHEGNYALPNILLADAQGRDTAIESEGE